MTRAKLVRLYKRAIALQTAVFFYPSDDDLACRAEEVKREIAIELHLGWGRSETLFHDINLRAIKKARRMNEKIKNGGRSRKGNSV